MNLSAHFTLEELTRGETAAPSAAVRANLERLAAGPLERARAALSKRAGKPVPLVVTNGYRAPAHNAAAGGVSTSQHLTGAAADVVAPSISRFELARWMREAAAAGELGDFGQLITYEYTAGHVHLSLPRGTNDRQVLRQLAEGKGYELLNQLPAFVSSGPGLAVLAVLLAGLVLALLSRPELVS